MRKYVGARRNGDSDLLCPHCGERGLRFVRDSRPLAGGDGIRRRRECEHCGERATTVEAVVSADLRALEHHIGGEALAEGVRWHGDRRAVHPGYPHTLSTLP